VARAICARLYARHWPPGPGTDADVERLWHIVAAHLEAGVIDETGAAIVPLDVDREVAAVRDWRARHPDHLVPPPASGSRR
jgi:hypothetical protein